MTMKTIKISVVGLGKLGAPLAAVMAYKGFPVIGLDLNKSYVDAINAGKAPVEEPRLQTLISASQERLKATQSSEELILNSDVTFVIVPTPSMSNSLFTNAYLLDSLRALGAELKKKQSYHLVVITSTVVPGSTGGVLQQALEECSGKKVGVDIGLCYNPEFIALGSVVSDMLEPDFILIGESDVKAGEMLSEIYYQTCDNAPPIRRMNFVNAELTKISVNTYVTTKISYANMLAEMCDHLPGADVDVVSHAVGSDTRIGHKYLRGATGYGGPCFPRDNKAFSAIGKAAGVRCDLAEATDAINDYQVERLGGMIEKHLGDAKGRVSILGLSYKPDTQVVEESQSLKLAQWLLGRGHSMRVYDPKGMPDAKKMVSAMPIAFADSAQACVDNADVTVVMTAWPEFAALEPAAFRCAKQRMLVLDPWRVLPKGLAVYAELTFPGCG